MTAVVLVCIGGKALDIGETCACCVVGGAATSLPNPPSIGRVVGLNVGGAPLVLGVAGTPAAVGTLPINHDGTQPRSPDSSFTA